MTMADDGNIAAAWTKLQEQAVPLLMLDLPRSARALEAGVASAGALLVLADLLETTLIADADPTHLERLKQLPVSRDLDPSGFARDTPGRALRRFGPVDLLLLSAGVADLSPAEVAEGVRAGGQVALAASGGWGAARRAKTWLRAAGLRDLSVMIPWPNARNAAAWVDVESASAWSALQSHFRPSSSSQAKRVLASVWRNTTQRFPSATRLAVREAAAVAYVVGRR